MTKKNVFPNGILLDLRFDRKLIKLFITYLRYLVENGYHIKYYWNALFTLKNPFRSMINVLFTLNSFGNQLKHLRQEKIEEFFQ